MENMFEDALIDEGEERETSLIFTEDNDDKLPIPTVTKGSKVEERDDLKFPVYNDDKTKLYCQVCGKLYKAITKTHLKFHDIDTDEYKKIYKTPLYTDKHRKHLSVVNKEKFKHLMKDHENKPAQEEVPIEEVNIADIVDEMDEVYFDQSVEEINDIQKPQTDPSYTKTELAYNIEELLNSGKVIENYFVEESSGSGAFPGTIQLKYSFVTDIAIPQLKVAFFFPDTYWHNREVAPDPNKYKKLAEDGWKCIVIKGVKPNMEEISKELRSANLI